MDPTFDTGTPYEARLSLNSEWALMEGSKHFGEANAVFDTLDRITKRLDEIGVAYAIVGGLALFHHGYRRFTEDVDLLVTPEGLQKAHEELSGLGYVPPFANSKHLRDTQTGVRVEFLTTGGYPGDGKPKQVAFPVPEPVVVDDRGRRYLPLAKLIELKIASGTSNKQRRKDLVDVQELIRAVRLPVDFQNELDPSVRETYQELWSDANPRFVTAYDAQAYHEHFIDIESHVLRGRATADVLGEAAAKGVWMEPSPELGEGNYLLVSTDPDVAEEYGLVEEATFWEQQSSERPSILQKLLAWRAKPSE